MTNAKISQAKPMTVWCLLAAAMVLLALGIGAAMFYMPAHGGTVDQRPTPSSATQ